MLFFKEKKSYVFDESTSVGNRYDPVIVPNVPLTSAFDLMQKSSFFTAFGIKKLISLYQVSNFIYCIYL